MLQKLLKRARRKLLNIDYYKIPTAPDPSVEHRAIIGPMSNVHVDVGRFSYGYDLIHVGNEAGGQSVHIGQFCSLGADMEIVLGNNHRTDWVTTYPFGHIYRDVLVSDEIAESTTSRGDVTIGNDVWIGFGVTIMSGVTIGDGAVVAANSHVVKDVAPYQVAGGNPAKPIRYRFSQEIIDLLLELSWWNLPIDQIRRVAPRLCAAPEVGVLRALIAEFR